MICLSAGRAILMIEASCHCGLVHLEVAQPPAAVNECTCSICRRYGTLWAYYSPILPHRASHGRYGHLHVGRPHTRVSSLQTVRLRHTLVARRQELRPNGCERPHDGAGSVGGRTPPVEWEIAPRCSEPLEQAHYSAASAILSLPATAKLHSTGPTRGSQCDPRECW